LVCMMCVLEGRKEGRNEVGRWDLLGDYTGGKERRRRERERERERTQRLVAEL